jgi:hypothetical protein
MDESRYVQVRNPRTDRYAKIDRKRGCVVAEKRSPGPWKGVKLAEARKSKE